MGFTTDIARGSTGAASAEVRAGVLKNLEAHRGSSIVIAGEHQPPQVHAFAHAINQALGNTGKTVIYTDAVEANPVDEISSIADLVKDMRDGAVRPGCSSWAGTPSTTTHQRIGASMRSRENQSYGRIRALFE